MKPIKDLSKHVESGLIERQNFVRPILNAAHAYCVSTLSEKLSLNKAYVECLENLEIITATDILLKLNEESNPIKKKFWTLSGYLNDEEEKLRKKRKLLDDMELTQKACYDKKDKVIRIGIDAENHLIETDGAKDVFAGLYLSGEMGHRLVHFLEEKKDVSVDYGINEFYDVVCQLTVLAKKYVDNPSKYLNQWCKNIASIMQEKSFYEFWVNNKDKEDNIKLLKNFYDNREIDNQDVQDLIKYDYPVHSTGVYIFQKLFSLTDGDFHDKIFAIASVAGHAFKDYSIDFESVDGYITTAESKLKRAF